MPKPPKALVTKQRIVHTYADLWHASGCVLKAGLENEKGSSWQFLSSIVLTAFAFEAYLNHVGAELLDCWTTIEPLSPPAKFALLCEMLNVAFPCGLGQRPLQTVTQLQTFRNTIAHGKTETVAPKSTTRDINDKLDAYLGERPLSNWEQLIQTSDFAKRARRDLGVVLTKLHEARPDPKEGLFAMGTGFYSASVVSREE